MERCFSILKNSACFGRITPAPTQRCVVTVGDVLCPGGFGRIRVQRAAGRPLRSDSVPRVHLPGVQGQRGVGAPRNRHHM